MDAPLDTTDTTGMSIGEMIAHKKLLAYHLAEKNAPKKVVVAPEEAPAKKVVVVVAQKPATNALSAAELALQRNQKYVKAGVTIDSSTYPKLTIAELNGPLPPATNPCYSNLVDGTLHDYTVETQYPGIV